MRGSPPVGYINLLAPTSFGATFYFHLDSTSEVLLLLALVFMVLNDALWFTSQTGKHNFLHQRGRTEKGLAFSVFSQHS